MANFNDPRERAAFLKQFGLRETSASPEEAARKRAAREKQFNQQADVRARQMREETKSSAEYQRRSRMTQTERSKEAISQLAGSIKEHSAKGGREITHEAAMKEAVKVAERADKKVGR